MDDIWDYIVSELQNRSAAEHVVDRIMDAVDQLKNFAEMGTPLSSIADVGTDYRFLVSNNLNVRGLRYSNFGVDCQMEVAFGFAVDTDGFMVVYTADYLL